MTFIRGFTTFVILCLSVQMLQAKQFGLVVGIDDYKHFFPRAETPPGSHTDLQGAVNDAKLIAKSLRAKGVDLPDSHVLLNETATTKNFLAAYQNMLDRAEPGDTFIITFAGHGGQEKEVAEPLDEKDNLDETLMFYEFDPQNPRVGRLNDDQIREQLKLAREFKIILVMDSCHSGGLERSINKNIAGASRNGGKWNITVEPLLDEIVPKSGDKDNSLAHVTKILATATDELLVTETRIDGQPHGALSYYFAQGISGDADADKNNYVSKRELSNYIETQVLAEMNQNQKPRLLPRGDDTVAFQLVPDAPAPIVIEKKEEPKPEPKPVVKLEPEAKPDNRITVRTLDGSDIFALGSDGRYVSESADITFEPNPDGWTVYNHTGDKIYHLYEEDELSDEPQKIIARTKFLKRLHKLVRSDLPLGEIKAAQSPKLQTIGSRVKFTFTAPSENLQHLTAFNLAGNGEFQYLYPQPTSPSEIGTTGLPVEFQVVPPAGADQLVGVYCTDQPHDLQNYLRNHNGGYAPEPAEFEIFLKQVDCQIGRIGLFTQE
ncbi:MAG: caspase family protein [Lentilitoribacter sp.]